MYFYLFIYGTVRRMLRQNILRSAEENVSLTGKNLAQVMFFRENLISFHFSRNAKEKLYNLQVQQIFWIKYVYLLLLTVFYCAKEIVCVCIYNNSNTNELLLFNNKQVEIFDELSKKTSIRLLKNVFLTCFYVLKIFMEGIFLIFK